MTPAPDRFNAAVTGRASARRAGGLQVPVRYDDGREDLVGCLAETAAGRFAPGRRVLIENGLVTELGA